VEGGGHLGRDDVGTLVLTRRLLDVVTVPVVASGGIADGYQIAALLAMGAAGVEMGTRFVATAECIAHPRYKDAIVSTDIHETAVIERPLGRPGRTLPSPHVNDILSHEAASAPLEQLLPLIAGDRNVVAAIEGELERGYAWAGQGTGLIHDIPTVQALMERIEGEADQALQNLRRALERG
jgi:enoyl-[acyl-carrier protein] reductase II